MATVLDSADTTFLFLQKFLLGIAGEECANFYLWLGEETNIHITFDYIFKNWKVKTKTDKVITYEELEKHPRMEAYYLYSLKNIIQIYRLHSLKGGWNNDQPSSNVQF